jgi:predicted small metal-binding protein
VEEGEGAMHIVELGRARRDRGCTPCPKKAWDCGCGWRLEAISEEALIAKVIYHLNVQHPEAHPTLEQAEELVATEAYEVLSA